MLVLLIMFAGSFAFAQDEGEDLFYDDEPKETLKNKNGVTILPQSGDFAVGMDLGGFFDYLGNVGNDMFYNSFPNNFFLNGNTFFFKYYLETDATIVAKLGVDYQNYADDRYVRDDAAFYNDPMSEAMVVDRMTVTSHDYSLSLGYQMYRGKGRLRAGYGAEVGVSYSDNIRKFEYGNSFTEVNTAPTTFDFNTFTTANLNRRAQVDQNYSAWGFGGDIFLALEFYVAPNIALGTEFAIGPYLMLPGQQSHTDEYWNGESIQTQTLLDSPGDYNFNFNLFNPSARLYLLLNF